MTPQEQDLITTLLTRLKSAGGQQKDAEADTLIAQAAAEQPDMPYYLVQTVLIQDLSLHNAQNKIAELERQVSDAQQKPTSFLGGLFGRSAPPAVPASQPAAGPWSRAPQAPPPPPQAAPPYGQGSGQGYGQGYGQSGYAPPPYGAAMGGPGGFMGGSGGGFLRSAAATAAGVAGGALLFEGISNLFGHHAAAGMYGGGMTPGLGETVINNYYGDAGGPGGGSDGGWSGDPGAQGGSDFASSDYDTGGGYDPGGGQDFSSDQDFGGGDTGGSDTGGSDDFTSC